MPFANTLLLMKPPSLFLSVTCAMDIVEKEREKCHLTNLVFFFAIHLVCVGTCSKGLPESCTIDGRY